MPLQDYAWITTNPTTGLICEGPPCLAYSVVECVSKGAQPLKLDSRNNIGCGNAGLYLATCSVMHCLWGWSRICRALDWTCMCSLACAALSSRTCGGGLCQDVGVLWAWMHCLTLMHHC